MNKKTIAIIALIAAAVITLCIIFSGGKDNDESETTASPSEGQPVTVVLDETEGTTEKEKKKDYDTKITVTLPIEVVDAEYGGDLDAFAEAKGYFSVKKVDDTHVKIRMREYSYRLLLTSKGLETVSGIGYAIDSGDYPFVIKFEKYNDDFSDVVFSVDREAYEKAENSDAFFSTVALYCLYYQDYCIDSEGKCRIALCEQGSNKVIEAKEMTEGDIK